MMEKLAQRLQTLPALGLSALQYLYRPWRRAIECWIDADGLRMSAAMSFYGILSLAPLLVLLVAILGWWLDRSYIETSLVEQIRSVIGAQGAEAVQQALSSSRKPSEGITASLFAFVLLLCLVPLACLPSCRTHSSACGAMAVGRRPGRSGGTAPHCACAALPTFLRWDFCCWYRW